MCKSSGMKWNRTLRLGIIVKRLYSYHKQLVKLQVHASTLLKRDSTAGSFWKNPAKLFRIPFFIEKINLKKCCCDIFLI